MRKALVSGVSFTKPIANQQVAEILPSCKKPDLTMYISMDIIAPCGFSARNLDLGKETQTLFEKSK